MMMNVEVVTPAGRLRHIEILYRYLKKQKDHFNKWTLWINTLNKKNIDYCKKLEMENDWIQTIDLDVEYEGTFSISSFFKHACDYNSIYIRLDDDIVWLDPNFIKNISEFRINNPEYFLVYANILNNCIIDYIHQKFDNLNLSEIIKYNCFDVFGWSDGEIAKEKHEKFISHILNNTIDQFKFNKWVLNLYERTSINCISWFGSEFAKFDGLVRKDEEQWLSVKKPLTLDKYNIIYGGSICSHFAFNPQRYYLENNTDLLTQYEKISLF